MTTLCVSCTEQAFWHLAQPFPPDILVYVCLLWQIYLEAFSSLFNWSLWPKYSGLHFSPRPRQCAELGLHVSKTEHQSKSLNSDSLHTCKCFTSLVFKKIYITFFNQLCKICPLLDFTPVQCQKQSWPYIYAGPIFESHLVNGDERKIFQNPGWMARITWKWTNHVTVMANSIWYKMLY